MKIFSVLAVVLLLAPLAACGVKGDPVAPAAAGQTQP